MQTLQRQSLTLYYREGNSDKVYRAAIEPRGTGFVVTFAFGRRGGTLQTGTKTPEPVSHEQAREVYNRLVKEKMAKGYTPGEDGTAYAQTPHESRVSGVLPQLLNPIDAGEAPRLIADDEWWAQEKFDGRRVLVHKQGPAVVGINRNGLLIGLPKTVVEAVQMLGTESCLLDGEAVGDVYHCFDLLERDGRDCRPAPYAVRFAEAIDLVDPVPSDHLRFVETATSARAKRDLLDRLRRTNREGAVFKQRSAPYSPGRPSGGGGPQLKLKFYATASCVVAGANGRRRSVALELYAAGRGSGAVAVGSVTIPHNHAVPAAGDVVEVRYLYAFPGGSLFQPVYLGRRDDVAADACDLSQLKYRPTGGGDEVS